MRKQLLKLIAIAPALLLLVWAAPSAAPGMSHEKGSQKMDKMEKKQGMTSHPGRKKKVSGEILKQKSVQVKSADADHKVVLVKLQKGGRAVVDLGPAQKLENVMLQEGRKIEADGYVMRVGDQPVLFAGTATIDGKSIDIPRHMGAQKELSGQILRQKQVKKKGSEDKNQVVLLRMPEGQRIVVDLGPATQLQRDQVQAGKKLAIIGHPAVIGNRWVYVADAVVVDGKQRPIDRKRQAR